MFLSAGTYCILYVFLEMLHYFIELSHATIKEIKVSHLNINKEETEVTQQQCSFYSSVTAGNRMGSGELWVQAKP